MEKSPIPNPCNILPSCALLAHAGDPVKFLLPIVASDSPRHKGLCWLKYGFCRITTAVYLDLPFSVVPPPTYNGDGDLWGDIVPLPGF